MRSPRYIRYFVLFSALALAGCSERDAVPLCADLACEDEHRTCNQGSATSDATCGDCVSGSYDDVGECIAWIACDESAEFESEAPTATSDRVCTAVTTCTSEEAEVAPSTPTSDRACLACDWDTEFWSFDASGPAECVPRLSVCPAGFGHSAVEMPFPRDEDYTCASACVEGTFNDGSAVLCEPYRVCDPATEYVSVAASAARNRQCAPFDVVGDQAFVVNRVYAGEFLMGEALGDPTFGSPRSVVLTRDYVLGRFEVTQAQYEAVMGSLPSNSLGTGDDLPVANLSELDAVAFTNKLNTILGLPPCYDDEGAPLGDASIYECQGYRLPTDAEWEYAARAGAREAAPANLDDIAWHLSNSGGQVHPVGQKLANAWGFFDTFGNVTEYIHRTRWSSSSGIVTDPEMVAVGGMPTGRGSSVFSSPDYMRYIMESVVYGEMPYVIDFGVRLARTMHEPMPEP